MANDRREAEREEYERHTLQGQVNALNEALRLLGRALLDAIANEAARIAALGRAITRRRR